MGKRKVYSKKWKEKSVCLEVKKIQNPPWWGPACGEFVSFVENLRAKLRLGIFIGWYLGENVAEELERPVRRVGAKKQKKKTIAPRLHRGNAKCASR